MVEPDEISSSSHDDFSWTQEAEPILESSDDKKNKSSLDEEKEKTGEADVDPEDPVVQQWDQHENNTTSEIKAKQELDNILYPKRSILHRFTNFIRFIVIIAAILMGAGEILDMTVETSDPIQMVLSIYLLALCLLIILNELEWLKIVVNNALLTNWITRGLFYAFVGVIGLEEYFANEDKILVDVQKVYIQTVAWGMIGSGATYSIMGLLCFQRCHHNARENYDNRMVEAKKKRLEMTATA